MRKLKVTEMGRMSVESFRQAAKMPLTVVLDDVRSMYNVGSIFRTADAFRVEEMVLCGITSQPPHVEIHKTALGAEDSVSWRHCGDCAEAVRQLQREGVKVLAVEQCEGSTMLQDFRIFPDEMGDFCSSGVENASVEDAKYPEKKAKNPDEMGDFCKKVPRYAIVLGNEVKGVQQEVVDLCDGCLEIPQFGTKHSLNVANSAAIVIWHFAEQLMKNRNL